MTVPSTVGITNVPFVTPLGHGKMTFGKKRAIDFEKTFNGGMLKKQDLLCAKSCRLCHDLGKLSLGTKFKAPILSLSRRSSEDVVEGLKTRKKCTVSGKIREETKAMDAIFLLGAEFVRKTRFVAIHIPSQTYDAVSVGRYTHGKHGAVNPTNA